MPRRRHRFEDWDRRFWLRGFIYVALGMVLFLFIVLPGSVLLALRWVAPPTTAFIWSQAQSEGPRACARIHYEWAAAERIPSHVALAVVAAEDQLFWQHSGFDMASIRGALEERMLRGRVRGASTISQQVVKNLFLWNGRSYLRKGLEAYLTLYMELLWSKRRILEMYLNVAQFGRCTFGLGAASQDFFGKDPADLTPEEAARLAAVLPNPLRMHADSPSNYVRSRTETILSEMARLQRANFIPELGQDWHPASNVRSER